MFAQGTKKLACGIIAIGCGLLACSVSVTTDQGGGGSVAFTIGGTTFKIDFGGNAVFDVTANGPPVEKVFAVQLFDETATDVPDGATLILEAESVQFIPTSPAAKTAAAVTAQQTVVAGVEVYLADTSTANPCADGVYVGTFQVFTELGLEEPELRIPGALMTAARSGLINVCMRVTATRDGQVIIREMLIRFDETESADNGNGNGNGNDNQNANDNTADNHNTNDNVDGNANDNIGGDNLNDNGTDNLNDNGDAIGGGIFTGCWEMNVWWDGLPAPGNPDYALSIDAFDNVERLWQHLPEDVWEENVRFTVPNSPYMQSVLISADQLITYHPSDDAYTISLDINTYEGSYNFETARCEVDTGTTAAINFTYSDLVFDSDSPDSFSGNFVATIAITTTDGSGPAGNTTTGTVTATRTTCPPPGAISQEEQGESCM